MVKKGVKKKSSPIINYAIITILILVILVSLVSIGTYFYPSKEPSPPTISAKPAQGIVILEIKERPASPTENRGVS